MAKYRDALPQLGGGFFLTDGGIEATLIFPEGLELKDFAAFDLLGRPGGKEALRKYFRTYAEMATRFGAGLVLESATRRANADLGRAPELQQERPGRCRSRSDRADMAGRWLRY